MALGGYARRPLGFGARITKPMPYTSHTGVSVEALAGVSKVRGLNFLMKRVSPSDRNPDAGPLSLVIDTALSGAARTHGGRRARWPSRRRWPAQTRPAPARPRGTTARGRWTREDAPRPASSLCGSGAGGETPKLSYCMMRIQYPRTVRPLLHRLNIHLLNIMSS